MYQNGYNNNNPLTFYNSYNSYYVNNNNRNQKTNQKPRNNPPSSGPPQLDQYGSSRYNTHPPQKKWQERRYQRDHWNPRNSSESSPRSRRGPEQMNNSVEQGEPKGPKPRPRFQRPFPQSYNNHQQQQQQQQPRKLQPQEQAQGNQPQPVLKPDPEPESSGGEKECKAECEAEPEEAEQEKEKKEAASDETKGRNHKVQDNSMSSKRSPNGDRIPVRNGNRNGDNPYDSEDDLWMDSDLRRRTYNNQRNNNGAYQSSHNHNKQYQNGYSTDWVNSSPANGNNPRNNFHRRYNYHHFHNNNNNDAVVTFGYPISVNQFNDRNHPQDERHVPIAVSFIRPSINSVLGLLQSRKDLIITPADEPLRLKNGSRWDQLSTDIWNKFIANQQCGELLEQKIQAWGLFYNTLQVEFGGNLFLPDRFTPQSKMAGTLGLYLVGSTFNGFALNTSDIDICFMVHNEELDRYDSVGNLLRIAHLMRREDEIRNFQGLKINLDTLELIQAKVPILKFWDQTHTIQFDVNCNNPVGVRNTHLLFSYSKLEWRVKPLVVLVKTWAKFHGINDAKEMTLSSYSLTLMVIHYLQCGVRPVVLPCLQKMSTRFNTDKPLNVLSVLNFPVEKIKVFQSHNKQTLGELLVGFFEYYAAFNFKQKAISVRLGGTVSVESCKNGKSPKNDIYQWKNICIEEPFDQTNTARSVFDDGKFQYILEVFRKSARNLSQTRRLESIFVQINSPLIYQVPPPPFHKVGC